MTTTLKAVRRRMLALGPDLGESVGITSLTTTTVVASRKATGTVTSQKYSGKWLLRGDAASQPADRERLCTAFTASTGTFTHAGTNYADTTATSETLEILNYEPERYDTAINEALRTTRFLDITEIPSSQAGTGWLGQVPWIEKPSDIVRIQMDRSGILSRNRYFDRWDSYDSSGNLVPSYWTLAGSGGTAAASTTQTWRKAYSLALTRVGTDVTLTQTAGLLDTGVSGTSGQTLRGATVSIVVRGWASVASRLRVGINDGVTTTYTSYHTGGSTWEELTTSVVVSSSATTLNLVVELNTGNTTAYLGEAFLVLDAVNDSQRRDGPWYPDEVWNTYGSQGGYEVPAELPFNSVGARYLVWSQRKFPALDATRLAGGTADADVILAPEHLVAMGAIWRMFDRLAYKGGEDTGRYKEIARDFRGRYERMQAEFMYVAGMQSMQERKLSRLNGSAMAYAGAGVRSMR